MLEGWKGRVRILKREVYVLYLAYGDPRVPWYARLFAACVVAYAFSPIDLVPDFVPVIGYLDDLLLVPLGIMLARKIIGEAILADHRIRAEALLQQRRPRNWIAAMCIVVLWLALALGGLALVWR